MANIELVGGYYDGMIKAMKDEPKDLIFIAMVSPVEPYAGAYIAPIPEASIKTMTITYERTKRLNSRGERVYQYVKAVVNDKAK